MLPWWQMNIDWIPICFPHNSKDHDIKTKWKISVNEFSYLHGNWIIYMESPQRGHQGKIWDQWWEICTQLKLAPGSTCNQIDCHGHSWEILVIHACYITMPVYKRKFGSLFATKILKLCVCSREWSQTLTPKSKSPRLGLARKLKMWYQNWITPTAF